MSSKITHRQAALATAALIVGTSVEALAEAIGTHVGHTDASAGQVSTVIITLWICDKLDRFTDDQKRR